MADLGKQFLDTDGLNALWTKHKKVQPFYQEIGTSGTNGWVNFLTVKATTYMNHPLVVRLLCQGYSDSTMDVQFASANNTAPTIQYFKQRIQPYSGTQAIPKPGYTYEDVDGVRYYKFWLKKNEASGSIGVHVESEYFYTTGAEDTGILTFPNVQSDTEPSGIVYVAAADIVYEAVPAKTAVSAAAVKVGTNAMGQTVLGNALAPSDLGISATTTSVTVGSTTANIPQATTTTPKMDGTAAVGTETKWAKGDHVHPTDTSRAPTSHASSATTYGVGTTANYGHVKLATGDMNGATHADGVAVSKNHTHGQYVPTTRTVNGHALSADVTVTAADVSAVRYDTASQGLTDTQKSNARTNIGAGTSNLTIGTTSTTAAAGNHTHTTAIASDSSSGTVVALAHDTQYKLTAGGTSVLFKTPADNNTDTKVTQDKDDSGTAAYPLLMAGAADPNGTATTAKYDSGVTLTPSTNTISANISGNAATATSSGKLTTGRELAVGLSNTSTTTTFDGSANVTNIKVSGQLPVANGGTGSNTAAGARTNLSVYSKSEIDSLMSGRVEIVTELPDTGKTGVTYYVGPTGSGADKYDEYIWTGSAFLKVGEHSLDLSNYVNTVATSGSGTVVTGVSKSGNTVTVTKGNISLDDLSDWATETDVTISNVTYHTMWPVAPTSSNQVYGISINNGRLFRIYNNKGAYSVQAYDKDSDTTYTPQKLGIGYGTCTTAEATAAKVATLADYTLVKNGIVAVKFSYPLCASATLNINGKGAKPVYVGGAAVTATNCKSVQAGDIGYFIYDGTAYHFLGTDRAGKSSITGLSVNGRKVTYTRADGETGSFDTQDTTYSFADSYNASTNKGATVATVTNAINALDVSDISGFGAGKTLATLKEENGKISATFQDISITKSQVSDFSHTHGNIQNGGTLQTNDITIANGDKLVVTDSSDSSKVARASIAFDGSTTTQALTKAGTWATFNNYSHPAGSAPSKTGVPTANATPGFGGTFKVNQITTDATSHVSAVTERTITIPNATATTSADGLMSAADKTKLDGIAAGTASPLMDGKASVGNSLKYAREDHVHPTDANKLNADGSNATTVGVTAMMRKVASGTADLNDDSTYFGDSNDDHTHIVRRPILNLWNYIKKNVMTQLLGSVGSADKPIYLENGVPKVCIDGVPFSLYNYGSSNYGCGVFVGGTSNLKASTRCYCTFLVSVSSDPDKILHTYIGTFTFRGKKLNSELRCLTGTPAYPLRIVVVSNVDGGTTQDPTYTVGLYVIPARKTDKYSTYRLTRIASSDFKWDVKNISATDYDNCDAASKNVFMTQTAMIKDVATKSTTDSKSIHIYYDDIICNNGSIEYSINIARLVIGKTYRFHIIKESQAATYLYNYGETGLGTVTIYYGNSSTGVTGGARFALNGSGTGTSAHTVTVARMSETQIYVIWGY